MLLPTGAEQSTREVRVRRPFVGSDLHLDADGDPVSGAIGDTGRLWTVQPGALLDSGAGAPGVVPGDVRFDAVLDDLVRLGLLERRDERVVAGSECTVYRGGAPLGDPLRPASPEEFVDWCIDGRGLLLEERWHLDGELLRTTTATAVEPAPPADDAFEPPAGLEESPNPLGTSTRTALATDEVPPVGDAEYWVARRPAGGFVLDSRWRVVSTSNVTGAPQVDDISFVDVYVRGLDVVVVTHREAAVAGGPVTGLETTDAGRLGPAQVLVSERGAELQAAAGPWVVSVRGTLAVDELTTFAVELEPVSAR